MISDFSYEFLAALGKLHVVMQVEMNLLDLVLVVSNKEN